MKRHLAIRVHGTNVVDFYPRDAAVVDAHGPSPEGEGFGFWSVIVVSGSFAAVFPVPASRIAQAMEDEHELVVMSRVFITTAVNNVALDHAYHQVGRERAIKNQRSLEAKQEVGKA